MFNVVTRILIVTAVLVIGPVAGGPRRVVLAQDSTPTSAATAEWPMFRGNPARTGAMPGTGPQGSPTELWRFQASGGIASAPAVVDGVVYVGCDCDTLYAVD